MEIKRVCVLGAGVMGHAIAAHMINAGLDCTLLDIPSDGKDRNKFANDAIKKIERSKPSLLLNKKHATRIKTGNIEDDLSCIKTCDLVIEAVVENLDIKQGLFKKVQACLGPNTIVASNTSGLSIEGMLAGLDQNFRERFLVMHFFNPVRYLHLLEIVPNKDTKEEIMTLMASFGEERLGKGVVIGKDTTNFVANRVGVYAMMETIDAVVSGDFSVEEIDAIFGPAMGRPKSAVFRTADVIGIDTFIHVAKNCYDNLSHDECHSSFKIPAFIEKMAENGWLGQKSGQGFYKKEGKTIYALDPKSMTYHEKTKPRFESIGQARNLSSLAEKISGVAYADDKAGRLFFTLAAKSSIYAASRLGEIADDIVDIDNAMKWGFGWEMGPFETWDAMGVKKSVERMQKEGLAIPPWVLEMLEAGRDTFYTKGAHGKTYFYCPTTKDQKEVKVATREWTMEAIKSEKTNLVVDQDAYSLVDAGNGALIIEFHSKMNAIDNDILKGVNVGLDRCENGDFDALVIANDGKNFSVGANILLLYMAASQKMWSDIDDIVKLFQSTAKRLKYSSVPTVAAPFQMTLGGGCELSMWCNRIQAHAETYIGLVEVGVGLIPGGGGNIEMVARTLKNIPDTPTFVTEPFLMRALETVAMAKVATSAEEAKDLLFLGEADAYSMNRRYLLHDAAEVAMSMARTGFIAPAKREYRLPGKNAYATFDMGLRQFLEGKFISEHDYKIAKKVAHVMTGGDTDSTKVVSEDHLLDLEREAFLSLCGEEKTMARIAYMLENNKPLHN